MFLVYTNTRCYWNSTPDTT